MKHGGQSGNTDSVRRLLARGAGLWVVMSVAIGCSDDDGVPMVADASSSDGGASDGAMMDPDGSQPDPVLAAFPGAEGFGAGATGGRGGRVIHVTTLAVNGPGSLQAALAEPGARTIVFDVSGVIDGEVNILEGDVTIAGQSSPGGIIVRGLVCDRGIFETDGQCRNVIVRHLRSRPQDSAVDPPAEGGAVNADALRLDGTEDVIFDHCSFANATDEAIQISASRNVTIQNSIIAETIGGHAELGGVLINYSRASRPLGRLSIHHTIWNRIWGRLPEISCEDQCDVVDSNCAGLVLDLELTSNVLWDPLFYPYYTGVTAITAECGEEADRFFLNLNWVENLLVGRDDFPYGMIAADVVNEARNSLYFRGNAMSLYPDRTDYELAYCCNDFRDHESEGAPINATARETRHDFPPVTETPSGQLVAYMVAEAGAFPRDPMDRRLMAPLRAGEIRLTPRDANPDADAFALDFDPAAPPAPLVDTDRDGMPDEWEQMQGLDPNVADHNGMTLSPRLAGVAGYTNLEVYLNQLADQRVMAGR